MEVMFRTNSLNSSYLSNYYGCYFLSQAFGDPVSVNNLDAPNMRDKSLELDSLKEALPEFNSEVFEQNSLGGEGEKKQRQSAESYYQSPLRTELKNILKVSKVV